MKNQKLLQLDNEIEAAKDLLADLEDIAKDSALASDATATEIQMNWQDMDGKALEISQNVKKPVNTQALAKAVATLQNYHERITALDRLIKALGNDADAKEAVKDAREIEKKLNAAYKAASEKVHTAAVKGFPQEFSDLIEAAKTIVAKNYQFDADEGDDPFRAYVWFNKDGEAFYGATVSLHNVKSKDSNEANHDTYTLCFAARISDEGGVTAFVRGDPGATLPMKGKYPESNIFTDEASLKKVITRELDLDDIALVLNKVDLGLEEEDFEHLKLNELVTDVTMMGRKTLAVTVNVPFDDKASIERATEDYRRVMAGIFGKALQKNVLRVTSEEGDDGNTVLKFELVSRVDTSGKPKKHLLNMIKIIAPQLGLDEAQTKSLREWARNGEA